MSERKQYEYYDWHVRGSIIEVLRTIGLRGWHVFHLETTKDDKGASDTHIWAARALTPDKEALK